MKHIAILGDGGWGTALAMHLQRNGHRVTVWGPFADYIEQIRATGRNAKFLPTVELPTELRWTADRAQAVEGAGTVVVAVPSRYYADVLRSFQPFLQGTEDMVSVTKGLHPESHCRMTQVAEELLGGAAVAALSGPSFAEEVAQAMPTAVALACRDAARAERLQTIFGSERFRVYTTDDVAGVELGGVLKNVVAVATGICTGLGFGLNSRAALITRGLAEMARLGCALGARRETFMGLSGMGDLILTCTGSLSRNRAVGERIGRGEPAEQVLVGMEQAVEGVWNCASARALARQRTIDVPITEQVYAVTHEGRDPRQAVEDLLAREPRSEKEIRPDAH